MVTAIILHPIMINTYLATPEATLRGSETPVRSNLAELLLKLRELPADAVVESLNNIVTSLVTPSHKNPAAKSLPALTDSSSEIGDFTTSDSEYSECPSSNRDYAGNEAQAIESDLSCNDEPIVCNCKKSRCLKLYCQCFALRIYCNKICKKIENQNRKSSGNIY